MAQVNLGNILYQANRIPEAMDLFNQAMRIKPAVAYYSLGNALHLERPNFRGNRTIQAGVADRS